MIAKGNCSLRDNDRVKTRAPEGILADAQNRVGQFDRLQVGTTVEGIAGNLGQSGEIFQLVEMGNQDVIGEHIA